MTEKQLEKEMDLAIERGIKQFNAQQALKDAQKDLEDALNLSFKNVHKCIGELTSRIKFKEDSRYLYVSEIIDVEIVFRSLGKPFKEFGIYEMNGLSNTRLIRINSSIFHPEFPHSQYWEVVNIGLEPDGHFRMVELNGTENIISEEIIKECARVFGYMMARANHGKQ